LFQYGCDADLGEPRCGIDLMSPVYRGEGTVAAVLGARRFIADGLAAFAGGWFTRGLVRVTSGANTGRAVEVKRHAVADVITIELWQNLGAMPAIGDAFTVTAGCDKQFATCREKFANVANYRGFPHMPGNDFLASYPRSGDADRAG